MRATRRMVPLPEAPSPNCLCLKTAGSWSADASGTLVHYVGMDPTANFTPLHLEGGPVVLREDISDWCFDHLGPWRLRRSGDVFWIEFKGEADVVVFKMQWGGRAPESE